MGPVEAATATEIDHLGVLDIAPGLAALALNLASHLDGSESAPATAAAVGRELRATLDKLRAVAPGKVEGDGLDELTTRRNQRRGA